MADLKPCPFCGSNEIKMTIAANIAKIRCRGCGVGFSRVYFGAYGSREEAEKVMAPVITEAWNRRANNG